MSMPIRETVRGGERTAPIEIQPILPESGYRQQAIRQQAIRQQALDLFEDNIETQRWLSTPKEVLDGKTPLEALKTDEGQKKVEELLYRAEYGIFG